MARSPDHLTVAQFDLLTWVSKGCPEGVYEGASHRVSARALHNRGLVRVSGRGASWTAVITPQGKQRLKDEAERAEAERERRRLEAEAEAERERERQRFRQHAIEVLDAVVAAGGRADLGATVTSQEMVRIEAFLAREGLLPAEQRLADEPTRMDPTLGVTAYLEPDFDALTQPRKLAVPRQLRDPHPAVVAFQEKRSLVSKAQLGRAARFLQAVVLSAVDLGWKVPKRVQNYSDGRGGESPDLALKLPSREVVLTLRELDERGRRATAYVTETDYYTRARRTTANKNFSASGRLEVTVTKQWDQDRILTLRDADGATLEEQLPALVRTLEIGEAEATWSAKENERRARIREARWNEVKKEAFAKLAQERNAARLRDELARREKAAAMHQYATEVEARAAALSPPDGEAAREWAAWIRDHADQINPINGPLRVETVTSCSHEELQPHMDGWSTYGPYRRES